MKVSEGIGRDALRLVVWYPLRWLILVLPLGAALGVMGLMGELHLKLSRGKRARIRRNLGRIWPPSEGRPEADYAGQVREYFRLHYIDRLLIFLFPRFTEAFIKRHVRFEGLGNLDAALKRGRGAILVHGHIGPVHVPLVSLAVMGYGMKQIGMPSDEGLSWIGRNVAFRLRLYYEGMIPAEIINADGFIRPAFRWLGENGIIMVTGDGTGTGRRHGRHAEFTLFNERVEIPLGPATIARKTGAALLPMFIRPGEDGMWLRVLIGQPIESALEGDEGVMQMTGEFVRQYEAAIREHPGYMHFLEAFEPGGVIISNGYNK